MGAGVRTSSTGVARSLPRREWLHIRALTATDQHCQTVGYYEATGLTVPPQRDEPRHLRPSMLCARHVALKNRIAQARLYFTR